MKNNATFDVIVIGLGIMGASATMQLAKSGKRVLAIDARAPSHCEGSSHTGGRIFRQAYWEGEKYLPMLKVAHAGWQTLQQDISQEIIFNTGGLFIGNKNSQMVFSSDRTARHGNIQHEIIDSEELRKRYPQFTTGADASGLHELGAYAISADLARHGMLTQAVEHAAKLRFGEETVLVEGRIDVPGVKVKTSGGNVFYADHAVVCAGPWIAQHLIPELLPHIKPQRIPVYWFKPKPGRESLLSHKNMPIFLIETDKGALLYGMPSGVGPEQGIKIGFHNRQLLDIYEARHHETIPRQFIDEISKEVSSYFVDLVPEPIAEKWCTYTMSSDESFILGKKIGCTSVFYASACSGHGFKFAPAVGKILSDWVCGRQTSIDTSAFDISRFKTHN